MSSFDVFFVATQQPVKTVFELSMTWEIMPLMWHNCHGINSYESHSHVCIFISNCRYHRYFISRASCIFLLEFKPCYDKNPSITTKIRNLHCEMPDVALRWRTCQHRADSKFVPSQWETALLCNDVAHWPGASLESALLNMTYAINITYGMRGKDRQPQAPCDTPFINGVIVGIFSIWEYLSTILVTIKEKLYQHLSERILPYNNLINARAKKQDTVCCIGLWWSS